MAPALVETALHQQPTFEPVILTKGKTEYGNYKEFFPGRSEFKKEEAEVGSENQPAARFKHYLPTWNPDEK